MEQIFQQFANLDRAQSLDQEPEGASSIAVAGSVLKKLKIFKNKQGHLISNAYAAGEHV